MDRSLSPSSPAAARSALAFVLALLAGLTVAARAAAQTTNSVSEQDLERGKTHYIASCARCHGVNGGGGEGPPLARARLPRAPDDDALMRIMNQGIPGTAMAGSRWLSEEELHLVAAYVRSLAPRTGGAAGDVATGDPVAGRAIFERGRCAGCHTVGGFGTARGPDLSAVGDRRGAAYLRHAILDPGAALPRGLTAMPRDFVDYLMVRVVDQDGNELNGMRMDEDSYTIQLKDARGNLHSFYKPTLRVLEKQFDRSLMRSYRDSLTDREVEDLVSYLMTLTTPEPRLIS
jgi:cytochrome c oxidase cbb3-type subunit III